MPDSGDTTVERVFQAALDLDTADRAAFLDAECENDETLRADVEVLLQHFDAAGRSFLAGTATDVLRGVRDYRAGDVIDGRYRIGEVIGEGGMGTVYRAEQTTPIRRDVAFKQIKLGMDTKQVLARFDAERQALAVLHHSCVASIFDAGIAADGRPYFVMEYAPGSAITEYCDEARLTLNERLELFLEVCGAIQHAHQHGIIHRDIKPSNVLVGSDARGRPAPKVIDFGVAKAISQPDFGCTELTEQGQLVGTPEFMSPEQAGAGPVDTRTDVYALGILLYVLLAGSTPLPPETFHGAPLDEICRRIRESDPQRPSTRLDRADDDTSTTADLRRATPTQMVRQLRGDLDWIVMKAIEKDPERRYDSASAMAEDIRRHLRFEPVLAGPPAASYRARKFVRRNRAVVIGSAAVFVALVAGMTATTIVAVGQARARIRAEKAEEVADAETFAATQISVFIREMLAEVAPAIAHGEVETVGTLLAAAADRVERQYADAPVVRGSLHEAIGGTFRSVGEYEKAIPHLRLAQTLYLEQVGPRHRRSLEIASHLALALRVIGDWEDAEAVAREALVIARADLEPTNPTLIRLVMNLAVCVGQRKLDMVEAEALYRESLELSEAAWGPNHSTTLNAHANLASLLMNEERPDEAEPMLIDSYERRKEHLGPKDPDTILSLSNLASFKANAGDVEGALVMMAEVVELRTEVLGPVHPTTMESKRNYGLVLHLNGRSAEAVPLLRDVFARTLEDRGDAHFDTDRARAFLMQALIGVGETDEAAVHARLVYVGVCRSFGKDHEQAVDFVAGLMEMFEEAGRDDIAAEWRAVRDEGVVIE